MIELKQPAKAFEALSHEARLSILRLLIPAGPEGVHAGAIAQALDLPANRLSFHLNRLAIAGLIDRRREGRHLYYVVRYAQLGTLVRFLVDDCCGAAPDGCLPDCPGMPATTATECKPAYNTRSRKQKKGG